MKLVQPDNINKTFTCKCCGSNNMRLFLDIDAVPTCQNFLIASEQEALQCSRGDIRLGFCESCGYIGNNEFNSELVNYSTTYENTQNHSSVFTSYLQEIVRHLTKTYDLQNKSILEIGCGNGYFLKTLCKAGNNQGIGFDPSVLEVETADKKVRFIQDHYSEKYSSYKSDLICCRHVLEHISEPLIFLESVRQAIGNNLSTTVFFEVPSIEWIFENVAFWDLFYEHCNYFSQASLQYIFAKSGFNVTRISKAFGNQYFWLEAVPSTESNLSNTEINNEVKTIQTLIDSFLSQLDHKMRSIQDMISNELSQERKSVFWGAGAKGVTLLNMLKLHTDQIPYVVDINPRKQGMFIAGTAQKIISHTELSELGIDTIFIMNPNYEYEIKSQVKLLGLACNLINL